MWYLGYYQTSCTHPSPAIRAFRFLYVKRCTDSLPWHVSTWHLNLHYSFSQLSLITIFLCTTLQSASRPPSQNFHRATVLFERQYYPCHALSFILQISTGPPFYLSWLQHSFCQKLVWIFYYLNWITLLIIIKLDYIWVSAN